ncbi:MAG TPA: NFACT family protein [Candidatus Acidoferrales bacterium]|nr:NFACT family protein [Candidatus Acidoferrales bacterium]
MLTDHLLVRRAARELNRTLAGRRVRDIGLTDRASVEIVFGGKGGGAALQIEPFTTPPLLWLEADVPLSLAAEPAWLRAAGAIVRGGTLAAVRARAGDRVVALEFGARSRFGVESSSRLILELVPRFGNVVALRGETIVAAAKTFSPAENHERSVEIGRPYELPPLPRARIDRAAFEARLSDASARLAALRDYLPALPRLIATSLVAQAKELALGPSELAAWFETQANEAEATASGDGPVHVYRKHGQLVQAHIVPLAQFEDLEHTTAAHLLPLFAETASASSSGRGPAQIERTRESLLRAVRRRDEAIRSQLEQIAQRERHLGERNQLRAEGERIYAQLFELPESERAAAKNEASTLFARYKKATTALPRILARRQILERERAELETLAWEIERADAQSLDEIESDLDRKAKKRAPSAARRKIVALDLPSGSRLYVGRSPRENAEVTFSIARPDDLWFHARNVPGAHVVLATNGRDAPDDDEIAMAASIAAYHSRARASASVDVDFTRRKYVRKQKNAAPGMVWYTDFKTIRVSPRAS